MTHFSASMLRPSYGPAEAAQYVRLPVSKTKRWADALQLPGENVFPLSFANLLQLHLLKAMRVDHGVSLQTVRRTLPELRQRYGSAFPLLQQPLHTDGIDLFLRDENGVVNLSRASQRGFREHFDLYLQRVDFTESVAKLYPFVHSTERRDAPAAVVIRPDVGFGRPTIAGTGIHTRVVASRFNGGDTMADLMEEYELKQADFEEVLRWEAQLRADAA